MEEDPPQALEEDPPQALVVPLEVEVEPPQALVLLEPSSFPFHPSALSPPPPPHPPEGEAMPVRA